MRSKTGVVVAVAVGLAAALAFAGHEGPAAMGCWPCGPTWAVAVQGSYAYLGSGTALVVVDLSGPHRALAVGGFRLPEVGTGVAVQGSLAYVADWASGLRVVDVSNPWAPVEVGFHDTRGGAWAVAAVGRSVWVVDWHDGVRELDLSNPSAPVEVGGRSSDRAGR